MTIVPPGSALLAGVVVRGNAIWLFRFGSGFPSWVYAVILLGMVAAIMGRLPLTISETGATGTVEYMIGLLIAFFNLFGYFLLSSAKTWRELRDRDTEIRRRNDELADTAATKDTLISVTSHDVRVPVWSAARFARGHLVEFDGDLNAKREKIGTLAESLERISGLLDSMLERAPCASGKVKLESGPI